jgi:hypothetical protein
MRETDKNILEINKENKAHVVGITGEKDGIY